MKRSKTPRRYQMEARECGAVALGIVLAYYGKHLTLATLREACGTSRDGVVLGQMVRAAQGFGLDVRVLKHVETHRLASYPRPFILYWDFNHFLVVEGISDKEIWVNDPGLGHRRLALDDEFETHNTGIIITLQPNADFIPDGHPPRLLAYALPYLGRVRGALLGWGVLSLARAGVDILLAAWLVALLQGAQVAAALGLSLALGHLLLLGAAYRLQKHVRTQFDTSADLLAHMMRLPMAFFVARYSWEISDRVSLPQKLSEAVADEAIPMLFSLVYGLALLFGLAAMHPLLGVAGLGIWVLNLAATLYVSWLMWRGAINTIVHSHKLGAATGDSLYHIETLRRDGGEALAMQRITHHLAKLYTLEDRELRAMRLGDVGLVALPWLSAGLIWGLGGDAMAAALMLLATAALYPMTAYFRLRHDVEHGLARLADVLAQAPRPTIQPPRVATPPQGRITLSDVSFGYDTKRPALVQEINLGIAPGEWVGLAGASGGGKSTLLYLMAGIYAPWTGIAQLDDLPAQRVASAPGWLRLVEAAPIIFDGSVAQNLSLFDPTISREQLIRAAKLARIHEAILQRVGGYDYPLDDNTRHFSAGELQRLMIARALVTQPKILLLDEATRTLGQAQENQLFDNLRALGCTVVLCAHRASTLAQCDRVVYIEGGRIVAEGHHASLSQQHAGYARLVGQPPIAER